MFEYDSIQTLSTIVMYMAMWYFMTDWGVKLFFPQSSAEKSQTYSFAVEHTNLRKYLVPIGVVRCASRYSNCIVDIIFNLCNPVVPMPMVSICKQLFGMLFIHISSIMCVTGYQFQRCQKQSFNIYIFFNNATEFEVSVTPRYFGQLLDM